MPKSGDWLKKPLAASKNKGWPVQRPLSRFPECCIKRLYPPSIHFSFGKGEFLAPQGLPSDTPRVLVCAANPMRPSVTKTNVFGSVFSRSPHLRPSTTPSLKDRAGIPPRHFPFWDRRYFLPFAKGRGRNFARMPFSFGR